VDVLFPIHFHYGHKPWDEEGRTEAAYAADPTIGKWYAELFDCWWFNDDPNIKIRLFNHVIALILGGKPEETVQMGWYSTDDRYCVTTKCFCFITSSREYFQLWKWPLLTEPNMSAINNSDTSPTQVLLNLLDNTSEQDAEKLRYFSCSLQTQLFKHASGILLMREGLLEWHQDIQESVSTLSSSPGLISQKLYSSPLFRSWLNRLVTSLLEEHQENQLRALLGLWNNMTYLSEDTAIKRVAIVSGYLVTWDVGLLFELRGEEGLCVVSVSLPIEQVEQRRLEGSSIIVSNTNPLLRMKLDEMQVPQRSGTTYYDQIDESSINFPPDFSHDTYESPYLLIKKYCPDIANDIDEYVSVIVPRGEPTGWTIHG
jgi:hypothetical protein